ncbi:hypothetical protein EHO65_03275 [Leptospira andrefontaineae]|uniref:Uncharacterized protein n=1 Tax=Leptospira andrefontaineae TaxID=2484976 RepID=A0A4R9HBN4_9LEPT|nr:hypothetical protein EHO65_03275 [Leptospira andrefontaineae]
MKFFYAKIGSVILFFPVLLVCFSFEIQASDYFDTLTSEKKPILGSDKEDKYTFRLPPFASIENWGPHYSLNLLILYTYTDYPKFKQTSFFPLIDHVSAKENESFKSYFFPFYYAKRIQGPQRDSGLNFSLFHYNSYESSGDKFSDSWLSFPSIVPLFGRTRKIYNGKEETFHFAIPFLFFRNRGTGDDWNHFLIFHWGEDKESSYGSILPLLYWGKGANRSHFSFFPLFYFDSEKANTKEEESHLTFLPFFSYNSKKAGKEGNFLTPLFGRFWWDDQDRGPEGTLTKTDYYLFLFINRHYKGGTLRSYKAMFPILFSREWSDSNNETQTNVLLIGGWGSDSKGDYSYSYLFPFMFHTKEGSFGLFPAYFNIGQLKFGLLPIPFYYSKGSSTDFYILNTYYTSNAWRSKFVFFPLFYRSKNESGSRTIFPFFYRNTDGNSSQNYFINTYLSWDKKGEFNQGIFFPLWFYKSQEYFHFLPFFAKGNQPGNEYTWLIPLFTYWDKDRTWIGPYYSRKNESGDKFEKLVIFPFFQWNNTSEYKELTTPISYQKEYKTKFENYSLVGLYEKYDTDQESRRRVYPFYFSNNTNEYSYWNVLGLVGRGFDKAGDSRYTYAFPFYFYKRDSFRLVLPFYFRFGKDYDIYTHFGIFHYWNRSEEKDNTWIWPLLWFSNVDKVRKEEFSTWFPLYWNWNNSRSKGDMFLPLWLNYYEADKTLELKLAYSSSKTLGSFSGTAGVGTTEKDYYLDADVSLFYSLFSISTRTSINKEELQFWKENHPAELSTSDAPVQNISAKNSGEEKEGLGQYNRLTREKVRSFWGVSALFGIFSYEKGDDKRHFRLLPLSWFSWSEKTADKVYAAPLFFSSKIGDESYFVLFPIYGRQEQKENFQESYLLFGFLRGKQGELRDYSILWPITRLYFSSDAWGFRVFPLVAHDQSKDFSRTISPFYYRKRIVEGNLTSRSFHSLLLPLYHSGSESNQNGDIFQEDSYSLFLPLYLSIGSKRYSSSGEASESNFYTLLSYYSNKKEQNGEESTTILTPFYYSNRSRDAGVTPEQTTKTDFLLVPGFYWKRSPTESKFFLLGYYSESSPTVSSGSFLGLVSSSQEKNGQGQTSNSVRIFPFYSNTETNNPNLYKFRTTWGLLYYSDRSEYENGTWNSYNLNPFGSFSSSGNKTGNYSSSLYFLPIPFLYTESDNSNQYMKEIKRKEVSFLKLVNYTSLEEVNNSPDNTSGIGKTFEKEFSAFILFSNKFETWEKKTGEKSYRTKSYLFPLYWYNAETYSEGKETHINFLLISDFKSGNSGLERLIFGPAFYANNSERYLYGLVPLAFYRKSNESKFWFALGLYSYIDRDWDRFGFAGIFDYNNEAVLKRKSLNLFLGLIHTELQEERTRFAILGGLAFGIEKRPDYFDANLLWLRYRSSPGDTLANFLPVYYYHSDATGTASLIPPVLGYFSSEKDGRFDMLGLGLLYYRNQKISKEEDLMLVGPGLFYYRKYPNSNGLNAMGILALPGLGGLLWDWEYEEKTKYSRYTILSLLYANVTNKEGKTKNKIFGIPLW